jgi:hypothetical protein
MGSRPLKIQADPRQKLHPQARDKYFKYRVNSRKSSIAGRRRADVGGQSVLPAYNAPLEATDLQTCLHWQTLAETLDMGVGTLCLLAGPPALSCLENKNDCFNVRFAVTVD